MGKRIKHYVKYTKKELENYTTQSLDTCVRKVNKIINLNFPSYGLNSLKTTLQALIADKKIGRYDHELNGIILDVHNIKIIGHLAAIRFDDPTLHFKVQTDCYVFSPKIGSIIKGMVKHISARQIGVIIYRVFNVTIRLADKQDHSQLNLNTEIEFRIKNFDLENLMPYIEGELVGNLTQITNTERSHKFYTEMSDDDDDSIVNDISPLNPKSIFKVPPTQIKNFNSSDSSSSDDEPIPCSSNNSYINPKHRIKMEQTSQKNHADRIQENSQNYKNNDGSSSSNCDERNHNDDKITNVKIKTKRSNILNTMAVPMGKNINVISKKLPPPPTNQVINNNHLINSDDDDDDINTNNIEEIIKRNCKSIEFIKKKSKKAKKFLENPQNSLISLNEMNLDNGNLMDTNNKKSRKEHKISLVSSASLTNEEDNFPQQNELLSKPLVKLENNNTSCDESTYNENGIDYAHTTKQTHKNKKMSTKQNIIESSEMQIVSKGEKRINSNEITSEEIDATTNKKQKKNIIKENSRHKQHNAIELNEQYLKIACDDNSSLASPKSKKKKMENHSDLHTMKNKLSKKQKQNSTTNHPDLFDNNSNRDPLVAAHHLSIASVSSSKNSKSKKNFSQFAENVILSDSNFESGVDDSTLTKYSEKKIKIEPISEKTKRNTALKSIDLELRSILTEIKKDSEIEEDDTKACPNVTKKSLAANQISVQEIDNTNSVKSLANTETETHPRIKKAKKRKHKDSEILEVDNQQTINERMFKSENTSRDVTPIYKRHKQQFQSPDKSDDFTSSAFKAKKHVSYSEHLIETIQSSNNNTILNSAESFTAPILSSTMIENVKRKSKKDVKKMLNF